MNMTRCICGLPTEFCSKCSGWQAQQELNQTESENEFLKLKVDYETNGLDAHGELWTEDEYQLLYSKLSHISNTRNKMGRKAIYAVALELGRTKKSIMWHFKHMFYIKNNPKAGKSLLKFKSEVGLC